MVRIDFHPEATLELEESARWYAKRSESAAQGFLIAIDAALRKISDVPGRFVRIDAQHSACSVEKYPYQVVFRNADARIYVVAIAHAKRRPGYWSKRSPM